jgi:hypothetical protein
MTVATALVSDNDPLPQIAEAAVAQALVRAGLDQANGILLFLTPEFARHAQQAVTAAARAAQCTQVAGAIVSGVFNETGWAVDRPAAAVMVFGGALSLTHGLAGDAPILSYSGATFPPEWSEAGTRYGGSFGGSFAGGAAHAEAAVWQQSRLTVPPRCSVQILGAQVAAAASSGLQLLDEAQAVEAANGYDLERLGGQLALKNLNRALPDEIRAHAAEQLHHLAAVLIDGEDSATTALLEGRYRAVAIIALNVDSSLTLAERVLPGQRLAWAIRQPASAEADMRQTIARLAERAGRPAGALVFSCIGRGPYFYGGEDRDLKVLGERFPGLPLLGSYGTGQIAAAHRGTPNRQLQNAVVTALISPQRTRKDAHVQSIA